MLRSSRATPFGAPAATASLVPRQPHTTHLAGTRCNWAPSPVPNQTQRLLPLRAASGKAEKGSDDDDRDVSAMAQTQSASSFGVSGSDVETPLNLGSAVLERMAKLRALDQYRDLMAEEAARATAAAAARAGGSQPAGGGAVRPVGADVAAANAGDDSALLLRGALLIARHRYPALDERKVYDTLDEMARRVSALLPADPSERYPLRVVAAINRVMYTDYGFRGNEEDYYNADNSCINRVMERRVGIPITLSLVYSEVARRVGLPMRGVNLPGHFMLQPVRPPRRAATAGNDAIPTSAQLGRIGGSPPATQAGTEDLGLAAAGAGSEPEPRAEGQGRVQEGGVQGDGSEDDEAAGPLEVLVDAFRSGEVCYPAEAEERISELLGSPVRIDSRTLQDSHPLPPRLFLMRMLGNLRSIYLNTQQVDSLLSVLKLMRATLGDPAVSSAEAAEGPTRTLGAGTGGIGAAVGPWNDPAAFAAAAASLARDEGLCYFALQRYPECLEALEEYMRLAQSGEHPLPVEEAQTVSVLMSEARKRMMQQTQ